jgi:probable rRNA maturation factor
MNPRPGRRPAKRRRILKIQVHRQTTAELPNQAIQRIADSVLQGEKAELSGVLSIVMVDDAAMRDLNLRFLKKDRPTDVIAFELGDGGVWGEVYVSAERTREQAADYGVPPAEELARCVIHGLLHLLGYDDVTLRERRAMKGKEEEYLGKAGEWLSPRSR